MDGKPRPDYRMKFINKEDNNQFKPIKIVK
jgi:hypothetical protein